MNGLLGQGMQPQMGGLLGGSLQGGMQQPQQDGGMPPEMMKIVDQIKMLPPDQKEQASMQIVQRINSSPKPENEKQQAIQQFIAAVQ